MISASSSSVSLMTYKLVQIAVIGLASILVYRFVTNKLEHFHSNDSNMLADNSSSISHSDGPDLLADESSTIFDVEDDSVQVK